MITQRRRSLARFLDAPIKDLTSFLGSADADLTDPELLGPVSALLVDKTVTLLRESSRSGILDEAVELHGFLASAHGQAVQSSAPEVFVVWKTLADLLAATARRADPSAVDSILRSYGGQAQKLIELLTAAGGEMPRSVLRGQLGASESYLSHMLRDLDEAAVIDRVRVAGQKEVKIRLGAAGHVAQNAIFPPWLDVLVDAVVQLRAGTLDVEAEELAEKLRAAGVPSDLAAQRIATALTATASSAAIENGLRLTQGAMATDPRFPVAAVRPDIRKVALDLRLDLQKSDNEFADGAIAEALSDLPRRGYARYLLESDGDGIRFERAVGEETRPTSNLYDLATRLTRDRVGCVLRSSFPNRFQARPTGHVEPWAIIAADVPIAESASLA